MDVATGTYTGNGTAQTVDTGLSGIDFLLIKGGANIAVFRTSTMAADSAKQATGGASLATGRVTSITGGTFDVGSNAQVNANAAAYYWLAIKAAAADCKVGTYTGDGGTQAVTGVGFQPDLVITLGAGARAPYFKTTTMGTTNSQSFASAGALLTTRITALGADGFTVSTNGDVNQTGEVFHYVALKEQADRFDVFTYTGDGADDRSITLALDPAVALTKASSATAATAAALRFEDQTATESFQIDATAAATDKIQSFGTDSMVVGTHVGVNETGGTTPYHGFAFDEGTDTPPVTGPPVGSAMLLGVGR